MAKKKSQKRRSRTGPGKAETFERNVVAKLVEQMETVGTNDFRLPWHTDLDTVYGSNNPFKPLNAVTDLMYNGRNWFMLSMASVGGLAGDKTPPYKSARFATLKQWSDMGHKVRKGAGGIPIAYFGNAQKKDEDIKPSRSDDPQKEYYHFMKHYFVFAAEQVAGLEQLDESITPLSEEERLVHVDRFVQAVNPEIHHGGTIACHAWNPSTNEQYITMPLFERFNSGESYYACLLHEMVHWTKHKIGRHEWLQNQEVDHMKRYALEELIAEIGAAMLCSRLDISNIPRIDYAALTPRSIRKSKVL